MGKPVSIRRFEQYWWGSTLLWLVATVLVWHRVQMTLLANAQTAPAAPYTQPATVAVVAVTTVLCWWLVTHGKVVGKWLVVAVAVLSGLQAIGRLVGLTMGTSMHAFSFFCFMVAAGLSIGAAVLLFRPDAALWFGQGAIVEEDPYR